MSKVFDDFDEAPDDDESVDGFIDHSSLTLVTGLRVPVAKTWMTSFKTCLQLKTKSREAIPIDVIRVLCQPNYLNHRKKKMKVPIFI